MGISLGRGPVSKDLMDVKRVTIQEKLTESEKALRWEPHGILRNVQEARVSGKRISKWADYAGLYRLGFFSQRNGEPAGF